MIRGLIASSLNRGTFQRLPRSSWICSSRSFVAATKVNQDIDPDGKFEYIPSNKDPMLNHKLVLKFKHCFSCSESVASSLVEKNKFLLKTSVLDVSRKIELLYNKKVKAKSIMENIWLLGLSEVYLKNKIKAIEALEPRQIDDFLPLIRVSNKALEETRKILKREKNFVPEGNRIYYFSKRLNVEPSLTAKYWATHMFMFEIHFEMLVENLNLLLEFEMAPISILRDLWAFKYLPSSIRARLERCQKAEKDNLKPWVIRCTEDILQNTLTITQERKELLGDKSVVEYLSERLGYEPELMKYMVDKHEQVMTVRVTKIKEILDYLLIEEKYKPFEVARVIRILCHSLDTTKSRLEELKSHGCRPTSLVTVCKSQNEYQKFLDKWIAERSRMEAKRNL